MRIPKIKTKKFIILALIGVLCGAVNGLLGSGGGIIAVFGISYVMRGLDFDEKDVFANTVAAILPISLFSASLYRTRGNIADRNLLPFILPAVLGGIIGAFLLGKIKTPALKKIFAVLVIYSGFSILLK